ncbi:hypothetical protein DRE_05413 [Drechslerella stenobrocha 248]|uniref:chitinase n=1 Tax=Drechslerella stenobrocha 248 TaxID=1043628 RepID=W7I959_9PEZI|nr:hypothetical protein DRE_05413 [Drechslerella stenobrocha 248]
MPSRVLPSFLLLLQVVAAVVVPTPNRVHDVNGENADLGVPVPDSDAKAQLVTGSVREDYSHILEIDVPGSAGYVSSSTYADPYVMSPLGGVPTPLPAPVAEPPVDPSQQLGGTSGGFTPGYRSVGYFVNWGVYQRSFFPKDLTPDQFTHINMAFLKFEPATGQVTMADEFAEVKKDMGFTGTSPDQAMGVVDQLFRLKQQYRNVKTIVSIGGWTYCQDSLFATAVNSPEKRATFAKSAVGFVVNYGMDGIDLDWEYPATEVDALNYVDLLRLCREELDKVNPNFELTIAAPCGLSKVNVLRIAEMDQYLDFWNVMAYDFAGGWGKNAGHSANFFPSGDNPASTEFSYVEALDEYLKNGVDPRKIVTGIPVYGHGFTNTDGPGTPFSGVGKGSWEEGILDYGDLSLGGNNIHEDEQLLASWTYDPESRYMVSFDTPKITRLKAKFIVDRGLGGAMFWETSADNSTVDGNMIHTLIETLGGVTALEQKQNIIDYPGSKYSNIRVFDGKFITWANPQYNN